MKNLSLILSFLLLSCASDESAIEKFNNCLGPDQQRALIDLENVSNEFIALNYPNNDVSEGYSLFLADLDINDKVFKLVDSTLVIETNRKIKKAFGEFYDEDRANFLPWSNLNVCLERASNSRYVDKFLKDKMSAGEIGAGIVGVGMNKKWVNPASGLTKTIFLTEVVFRTLYFETRKQKN